MSLIRSVNNDLKCGQFAPAGGGQFAPAEVVNINRQEVVSLLWRGLLFLSGLSSRAINRKEARTVKPAEARVVVSDLCIEDLLKNHGKPVKVKMPVEEVLAEH